MELQSFCPFVNNYGMRTFVGAVTLVAMAAVLIGAGFEDDFRRERSGKNDEAKSALEGAAPPALEGTWLNAPGGKLDWNALKGKVVVLDFWAHWCGPCRAAVPKVKEMLGKYGKEGLVFIGVHSDPNETKMKEAVKELGMNWPTLFDGPKTMFKAFGADSYPDYYIIDRKGVLRFADIANAEVERAVQVLLDEKV